MSHYKPYPSYKDSGVEWLGEVPEGWKITKLKRGYSVKLGKMLQPDSKGDHDQLLPYMRASNIQPSGIDVSDVKEMWLSPSECVELRLVEGDLLVSEGGDVGRCALWSDEVPEAYYQNSINRIRSINENSNIYLSYLIKSIKSLGVFDIICNRLSIAHLTAEKLNDIDIIYPSHSEQHAIASFLDRETTRIDTLVEKKTRFIELLKEKRQALITHAVTKGLDPNVKMKDSGVEWLGEVPEGWIIIQSRRLFEQRKEKAVSGDQQLTASQKHGIIFQKDFMSIENQKVVQVITGAEILKHVEPNDFVISMRSFQGGLELSNLSGSISSAYVMLIPRNQVEPQYFKYLFKSITYIQALQSTSDLVRDGQALRYENFTKVPLPIFSKNEQLSIAKFLDGELARIDTLVEKTTRSIDLLKERRTALITAAVTGKIDVRGEFSLSEPQTVTP